jgi:hypothetical protein
LWAPKAAIEAAEAEAAPTETQRLKRREHLARSRAKQEAAYRDEFEETIRRFLAFAPEHGDLADEIAREPATRAVEVGSGRVGRTRMLSLEERASLAARAVIRHRHTSYEDDLFDASMDDPWGEGFWYREIKTEAQRSVDDFLNRHREAPSVNPGRP